MTKEVKVRFAPSPTGYLHVGGARTALFNWLYARKYGGKFLLRIEDTDQERSSAEALQAILDGLKWLGLDWDEEMIFQSKRVELYRRYCQNLLQEGKAYYCYCSPERLEEKRRQAQKEKRPWKYDGTCRALSDKERERLERDGIPRVIRFRVPEGKTIFQDLVHGEVVFENDTIGDFVILRSDGHPVYQMAAVVDDALTGISLVLRGDDHLSNTPKQLMLYEALGFSAPRFAHVPQILGPDRKRLSKRHGAKSLTEYKMEGYLPEAVVNFLALLGWSPGDNREKMTIDELIDAFSIEGISKKSAIFDERKLEWLNGQYLRERSSKDLFKDVVETLRTHGLLGEEIDDQSRERVLTTIDLLKERVRKLTDFVDLGSYFFQDPVAYEEKGKRKHWADPAVAVRLQAVADELSNLDGFAVDEIEKAVRNLAGRLKIGAGELIHPIRLALSGRTFGPGLFELMEVLGKETVVRRLRKAIDYVKAQKEPNDISVKAS
ncbi:MAG TPA: glutamate--tRNA ligase [Candidatus Latescibacteria bacterium]|nr:glutamate--tRNA ligase [Candidatus Latescibacterota bacterium]